jgi:broad specificity phosphatase PhoE
MGINQGHKHDFSLTEKGREQSKRIAEKLASEKIDAIYSSDLKRAKETAEIIARPHNLSPILDRRLRERDFGDLNDNKDLVRDWKAHVKKIVQEEGINPEEVKTPNGESDKNHWDRIQDFFNEKIEQHLNETILVVSHAGSNKVFLGIIGHFSKKEMYKSSQGNTGLNESEYKDGVWTIKQVNSINHLEKDIGALEIFNKVKNEKDNFNFYERWKINKKLFEEFKKEGYRVKYTIVSFKWESQNIPKELLNLNHPQIDKHLIVSVKSQGIYQKLDLSKYTTLKGAGEWDSYEDCKLSIAPEGIIEESKEENFVDSYCASIDTSKFEEFYNKVSKFMKSPILGDKT